MLHNAQIILVVKQSFQKIQRNILFKFLIHRMVKIYLTNNCLRLRSVSEIYNLSNVRMKMFFSFIFYFLQHESEKKVIYLLNSYFNSNVNVKVNDFFSVAFYQKNLNIFFSFSQERGSSSPHPGGDKEHGLCGLVDGIGGVSAGDLSLAGKSYKTFFANH